jgi:predicted TIM-barrel fold metal-dependent hydrolase
MMTGQGAILSVMLAPDDAVLFDLLSQRVPDEGTRNRILVRNPEALYGWST